MSPRAAIAAVLAAATMVGVMPVPSADAGQAHANISGTWTGTIKCQARASGAKIKFTLTSTLRIAQDGLIIGGALEDGFDITRYVGISNPDAKKPAEKGELALVACGTNDVVGDDPDFDEVVRLKASTKPPQVKATLKGTSIYSDPEGLIEPEAGTCKWKFTRIDLDSAPVTTTCTVGLQ